MQALKQTYCLILLIFISVAFYSCGTKKSLEDLPDISSYSLNKQPRLKLNDSLFFKDKNSLRKNEFGQWELVAFGNNPYDLGNTIGALTQELIINQEQYFFEKVKTMVPSEFKQNLLRKFLVWYGRKMYLHIPEEYKAEMYGISKYGTTNNELFGSNYLKTLFLHGAHDIGHALQDLALVGCSSFAVWDDKTPDGNLLIARNFDFYAGDEFAKEKLISFIQPEEGHSYMAVSWAGMIGVMSGMNTMGLTVTINAGKSDVPLLAKTPISLVTREILQNASTLEEAIAIARKREVFVSEAILVGSAIDNNAVLIEMSPDKFDVFKVENSSKLICSNHFQSETYKEDVKNLKAISESHSKYRFDRMEELLSETDKITPQKAVAILRNREGLENLKIGYGNEKALNQLLAHHGIVFQPAQKKVWVSANPYQLGEFVAFQLDSVFANATKISSSLSLPLDRINKDVFLNSTAYSNYEKYRLERRILEQVIKDKKVFEIENLEAFIALNPEFWEVYYIVGTYYYNEKNYKAALTKFEMALSKEITTVIDKENVEKYIKKTKRRLNDS